jgi:predicted transcriptional regulator
VLFQDAVARHAGLNSTDLQTVGLLMGQGPSTPGELAAHVGMTAGGSITAVIDRLERLGYVSRRRDETDRRRVLVEADVDKVLRDVGPVYGRVAARWEAYVQTLDDDQLLLAVELFRQAAQINRDETQRLRQERGNPPA